MNFLGAGTKTTFPWLQNLHQTRGASLTDATGHTHPATPVTTDANGLPTSSGSWAGPGRWIVRLTAPLTGAKPGTSLVLHLADGTSRTFTVATTRTTTTATAASSRTPLTVMALTESPQFC